MAEENPNFGDAIKAFLIRQFTTCIECRQLHSDSPHAEDWALKQRGRLKIPYGIKCPDCQSPEERTELVIRQAERQMLEGPNPPSI